MQINEHRSVFGAFSSASFCFGTLMESVLSTGQETEIMTDYVKIIVILISHFQHFSTSSLLASFPSPPLFRPLASLRRFPPKSYTRSSVCECVSECARMYVSPTPNQVSSHAPLSLSRKLQWENFSPLSLLDPHPCLRVVNVSVYCSQSWSSIVSASWLFTWLFPCAFHSLVNRKQRERTRETLPTSDSGWSDLWRALCRKGQQMFI